MSKPSWVPGEGDVIEAWIRFPRGIARKKCLVTRVTLHTLENGGEFLSLVGRFETKVGFWSVPERVLQAPWTILQKSIRP